MRSPSTAVLALLAAAGPAAQEGPLPAVEVADAPPLGRLQVREPGEQGRYRLAMVDLAWPE